MFCKVWPASSMSHARPSTLSTQAVFANSCHCVACLMKFAEIVLHVSWKMLQLLESIPENVFFHLNKVFSSLGVGIFFPKKVLVCTLNIEKSEDSKMYYYSLNFFWFGWLMVLECLEVGHRANSIHTGTFQWVMLGGPRYWQKQQPQDYWHRCSQTCERWSIP